MRRRFAVGHLDPHWVRDTVHGVLSRFSQYPLEDRETPGGGHRWILSGSAAAEPDWVFQERQPKMAFTYYPSDRVEAEWVGPGSPSDDFERACRELEDAFGAGPPQVARQKGGRPRYPEDDWACRQVWEFHRPKSEVFKEWLERARDRNLADPEDSFRKVISKARWLRLRK